MPPRPSRKPAPRPAAKTGTKARGKAGPARRPGSRRKKSGIVLPWRGVLLLLLLLLSLGALAYLVFLHQPTEMSTGSGELPDSGEQPPTASAQSHPLPAPARSEATASDVTQNPASRPAPSPAPSTYPESAQAQPPRPAPSPAPDDSRPRVAIIIDDMGFRPETEQLMLALKLELTFSFIPFSPYLAEALPVARRQDRDILLHLPLEALDPKWSSTPGMLMTAMNDEEIAAGFAAALAEVPMAIGMNNHMGSKFTADPASMERLLAQAARYDLFFLDSLTTPNSVAATVAARRRLPFLRRDIFLDNDQDEGKIRAQLGELLKVAEKEGQAVAIGHSYPETLRALQKHGPELERRVRLVGLSQLYQAAPTH